MTWAEIVACLTARGHVVAGEADWCGLIIARDEKKQRMTVKHSNDTTAVMLAAQVCPERYIDATEALAYNNVVEEGALGLENEVYVLRRRLPLATLTEAELMASLETLMAEAQRLRRRQVQPLTDEALDRCARLFAHWC